MGLWLRSFLTLLKCSWIINCAHVLIRILNWNCWIEGHLLVTRCVLVDINKYIIDEFYIDLISRVIHLFIYFDIIYKSFHENYWVKGIDSSNSINKKTIQWGNCNFMLKWMKVKNRNSLFGIEFFHYLFLFYYRWLRIASRFNPWDNLSHDSILIKVQLILHISVDTVPFTFICSFAHVNGVNILFLFLFWNIEIY